MKTENWKRCAVIVFLLGMIGFAGCRGGFPEFHVSQDVDLSYIRKVAIIPFDNMTEDKYAGDVVRQIVTSELLASGMVDVSVPGQVRDVLDSLGIRNVSSLSEAQLKEIGQKLKVQAVVFGSVEKFGDVSLGNISAPEVTITLMMAEANSGSILWSVTKTRIGADFAARHFGARAETLSETALLVIRDAIHTLYSY